MKYVIYLMLLLPLQSFSQSICCATPDSCTKDFLTRYVDSVMHVKDSMNDVRFLKNDGHWDAYCIVYPVRKNGVNTWKISKTNGHYFYNIKDSVVLVNGRVNIYYTRHTNYIVGFQTTGDETTKMRIFSQDAGAPAYTKGGYIFGATVNNDYASISASKEYPVSASVSFISGIWTIDAINPGPYNVNSPKLSVTTNNGLVYVDTKNTLSIHGFPIVQPEAFGTGAYSIYIEKLSATLFLIKIFDLKTGQFLTGNPSGNVKFDVLFGYDYGEVDMATEDFGKAGNFQFDGHFRD